MNCCVNFDTVDAILKNHGYNKSNLVTILQEIQKEYSYLPKEIFPFVSKKLNVSEATIYGVATFYENFSLEAKGKYVIRVCDGTACHVRHSVKVLAKLRNELGLSEEKKTTDDQLFTVETVSCLGACGLAPAITVNGEVHASMTEEKVAEILKELKENEQ